MYIYACVCAFVYAFVCRLFVYLWNIYIYLNVCILYICVCIFARLILCICIYMHIHICECLYVCVRVPVCLYTFIYICIYIHTHTLCICICSQACRCNCMYASCTVGSFPKSGALIQTPNFPNTGIFCSSAYPSRPRRSDWPRRHAMKDLSRCNMQRPH